MKLPYIGSSDYIDRHREQQFDQLYAEVSDDARALLDGYVKILDAIPRIGPGTAKSLIVSCLRWRFEHEEQDYINTMVSLGKFPY